MCVLAHPDDESLGTGGALAKCAAEGVATYLVTATRGERGRFGDSTESPGPDIVGKAREAELRAAANELGLREVTFLDYPDGALDKVDTAEASAKIAGHLRRVKPHVVITFGPEGAYGHPDHIAISQLTTAAIVCAADPSFGPSRRSASLTACPSCTSSRGARRSGPRIRRRCASSCSRSTARSGRRCRGPTGRLPPSSTRAAVWPAVWRAVSCHKTQMTIYRKLEELSEEHQRSLWGTQEFYRVFSGVNGGRAQESDLFEGLR